MRSNRIKQGTSEEHSIAQWSSCIQRNCHISFREQAWKEPKKLTPFHCDKNWCYQSKSRWNSLLRQVRWSFLWKQLKRSIMQCRKALPGHTTLAAWCRRPMGNSSLRLLHHLRGSHELIRSCKADSLSAGKWAAWLIESSSISNTTSTVAGPSHFSNGELGLAICKLLARYSCCAHSVGGGGGGGDTKRPRER